MTVNLATILAETALAAPAATVHLVYGTRVYGNRDDSSLATPGRLWWA
jgi:hypothetical protein